MVNYVEQVFIGEEVAARDLAALNAEKLLEALEYVLGLVVKLLEFLQHRLR